MYMYTIQTNSIDRIYRYIKKKYIYLHRVTSDSAALFCHSGGRNEEIHLSLPKLATKAMWSCPYVSDT